MAMAMASSSSPHHGFLTGSSPLFPLINKNQSTSKPHRGFTVPYCRSSMDKKEPEPNKTNIYINPPVAPPLVGGYGYGVYGGWGWSPFSFFAPGPSVAVGVGGGFDFFLAILVFGAIATVVRRFSARGDEDEDDY
ncbi:uncharacterized protein A4U43_C01F6600 [Asparagus officinalis]|uniref:Transmembrane protein n=1 Tax=Asparagus officinalis TaxID=4686 RepID=A0A5P1FRX2_ASPOF|nr:uncharacterized protein A4U43_C01F6600 [Asparagus officinalis]